MGSGGDIDPKRIVIGEPLPFSIFTAEGKLLLAQGRVVESERLRDVLIRNGHHCDSSRDEGGESGGAQSGARARDRDRADCDEEPEAPQDPLDRLYKDYSPGRGHPHLSIIVARPDSNKSFPVQLMGVHGQSIIVTAPVHADSSLVPVVMGQAWVCRTFQLTSAFRFSASTAKVAFEPFPHLHLKLGSEVEYRRVRGAPRAKVHLRAELCLPESVPCLITDLSSSGACVALNAAVGLSKGQQGRLVVTVELMQSTYTLCLNATVVNPMGPTDSRHPQVAFYGVKFSAPSETDGLVLHGFVGEHLLSEFHALWQVLMMAARAGT